ncbi:glycosyltransferase, partial [Escherichia coli]|nr:glycosyltransferase [Escherichia coli]
KVDSLIYCKEKKGKAVFNNLEIYFTGCGWFISNFKAILFLCRNAIFNRHLDLLIFHLSLRNIVPVLTYKLLFKGELICKMDLNTESAIEYSDKSHKINGIKKKLIRMIISRTDQFYVETIRNYNIINKGIFDVPISGKLKLMPNGVDAKLVREVIKTEGPDVFKENTITIISRHACEAKAPNRIFDVIDVMSELKLNNWTLQILGYFPTIFTDALRIRALECGVNIICDGYNLELYDVYKRLFKSKMFICLSLQESYCISLVEAAVFNNHIISTNVGVAEDLSLKYGNIKIIENYSKNLLSKTIEKTIKNDIKIKKASISDRMLDSYSWDNIITGVMSE